MTQFSLYVNSQTSSNLEQTVYFHSWYLCYEDKPTPNDYLVIFVRPTPNDYLVIYAIIDRFI